MGDSKTASKPADRQSVRLTKNVIDRARYEGTAGRRHVLWDATLPSFGVRVYPSGRKTFVLAYRAHGSRARRLMVIGSYGALTLEMARAKAKKEMVRVADGHDPIHEKKAASAVVMTWGELCNAWLEEYAKTELKSWRGEERRMQKHLTKWNAWPLTRLTFDDVRALHRKIGATGARYEANRTVALVRRICGWGKKERRVKIKQWENPASEITPYPEKERVRWLSERELGRLFRALDREDDQTRAIVRLLLLTGCRKSEIFSARWDCLDLEARRLVPTQYDEKTGEWRRDTKAGEEQVVQLNDEAVDIIRALPHPLHSPFVFPSRRDEKQPIEDIKKQWNRIRRRARLNDATLHDLRRTMGSALISAGVPREHIKKAQRHKTDYASKRYTLISDPAAAAAMQKMGNLISAVDAKRKKRATG